MKIQVISYGRRKSGVQTAQVVIKKNEQSFTKHLVKGQNGWQDADGQYYDLSEKIKQAA